MFRLILATTLIITGVFGFEVEKHAIFTKNITPSLMSASFSATMKANDKSKINKAFKKAIDIAKKNNVCKNGSYRIYPAYSYTRDKNGKNIRVFDGYSGNIHFECKFTDTKIFDKILDNIEKSSSRKNTLKLSINPIRWVLQKDVEQKGYDELELMALRYPAKYEQFLSQVYQKRCLRKKITLLDKNNPVSIAPTLRKQTMRLTQNDSIAKPIKSDFTLRYNASYIFECK